MAMVTEFYCYNYNDEWYLLEMALSISPKDIEFNKIVVPEDGVAELSWQTVLAEQFLNNDGTERICDLYDIPDGDSSSSRVAFFIFKTKAHILRTPYGEFELSDANKVPARLKSIIKIDEDYM